MQNTPCPITRPSTSPEPCRSFYTTSCTPATNPYDHTPAPPCLPPSCPRNWLSCWQDPITFNLDLSMYLPKPLPLLILILWNNSWFLIYPLHKFWHYLFSSMQLILLVSSVVLATLPGLLNSDLFNLRKQTFFKKTDLFQENRPFSKKTDHILP